MIRIKCNRCGCTFDAAAPDVEVLKNPVELSKRFFECPNCGNHINMGYLHYGATGSMSIKMIITSIVECWVEENKFIDQHSDSDDRSFIVFEETKNDLIEKLTKALTLGKGISGY